MLAVYFIVCMLYAFICCDGVVMAIVVILQHPQLLNRSATDSMAQTVQAASTKGYIFLSLNYDYLAISPLHLPQNSMVHETLNRG